MWHEWNVNADDVMMMGLHYEYMCTPNTKFGETLMTHISTTESPIVLEISSQEQV